MVTATEPKSLAISFDAEGRDREVALVDVHLAQIPDNQLIWVDGQHGSGFEKQLEGFPPELCPSLNRKDLNWQKDGDIISFALPLPNIDSAKPWPLVRFVFGHNWVLTASTERLGEFDEFLTKDLAESIVGQLTAAALVAALVDSILDTYRDLASKCASEIDRLEETVLNTKTRDDPISKIAAMRRHVSLLREKTAAQRATIHSLVRPDVVSLLPESDQPHYRNLQHRFERLEDDVARLRDSLLGTFELYSTRMAEDTNRLVKALTVVTVITGVIGMLAGIFGMNFEIPFMKGGVHSFVLVVGGMTLLTGAILGLAWYRRWF